VTEENRAPYRYDDSLPPLPVGSSSVVISVRNGADRVRVLFESRELYVLLGFALAREETVEKGNQDG